MFTSGFFGYAKPGWGCNEVGVLVSRFGLLLFHVPFSHFGGFCLSSTPRSELTSSLLLTFVYLTVNLFMELY